MSIHTVIDNGVLAIAEKMGRFVTKKELCKAVYWKGVPPIRVSSEMIDTAVERLQRQGKFIKEGEGYRIANPGSVRSVKSKKK